MAVFGLTSFVLACFLPASPVQGAQGGSQQRQELTRIQRELEKAKESLDEIRLMLADTRARARGHYYKTGTKQAAA